MRKPSVWLCISASLLVYLPAKSQALPDPTKRWSIGVVAAPGIGFRNLSLTEPSTNAQSIINLRDQEEDPSFNISGQIALGYRLSSLFSLEGGIGYAELGWQQHYDGSEFGYGDMIDPRRGFIYHSPAVNISSLRLVDSFQYVEIPLQGSLHLGHGRFRSVTSIGISTAYLVRATSTAHLEFADGSTDRTVSDQTSDFKKFGLFATLSSGVSFQLSDRVELQLQPTFRYGLVNVIDAPITANLWSAGLAFSAWMKL